MMELQEDLQASLDANLANQHALLEQLEQAKTRAAAKEILEQLKDLNQEMGALVDQLED